MFQLSARCVMYMGRKTTKQACVAASAQLVLGAKVATVTVEGWTRLVPKQSLLRSFVFDEYFFGKQHWLPIAV